MTESSYNWQNQEKSQDQKGQGSDNLIRKSLTNPYLLCRVDWEDTTCKGVWSDSNSHPAPVVVQTAGWLVYEGVEYITVASSWYRSDEDEIIIGEQTSVPWGAIRNVHII